jgi:hypothetical protein
VFVSTFTTYTAEHTVYTDNKQTADTDTANLGGGAVYLAGDDAVTPSANQAQFDAKWCVFEQNTAKVCRACVCM